MNISKDFEQIKNDAMINTREKRYSIALQLWAMIRKLRPDFAMAYSEAVNILNAQKKFSEAEMLCNEGFIKCKNPDKGLLIAYANIKNADGDYNTALERWASVRKHFPNDAAGYRRAGIAAKKLKRYDLAEALCRQGLEITDNLLLGITYAEIALDSKKYPEALERYARIREKNPNIAIGYRGAAIACMKMGNFDQADEFCLAGIEKADNLLLRVAYAEIAMTKADYPEALKRWEVVREMYPGNPSGYSRAANAAIKIKNFELAEELCLNGMLLADSLGMRINYAEISMAKADYDEALKRWEKMRELYPENPAGYSRAANAAIKLNRYELAEELCLKGMETADSPGMRINYAEIAMIKNDYDEALNRWEKMRELYPTNPIGYSRATTAARKLHKLKIAEDLCRQGMEIADSAANRINFAEIALAQSDLPEAFERWATMRKLYPSNSAGYSRGASAALKLKRFEVAEDLCRQGMAKADSPAMRIIYAEIAMGKADYVEALKRWAIVREMYPENHVGYARAMDACKELGLFAKSRELFRQGLKNACHMSLYQRLADSVIKEKANDIVELYKELIDIKEQEYNKYHLVSTLMFLSSLYLRIIEKYRLLLTENEQNFQKKYHYTNLIMDYKIKYNNILLEINKLYHKNILDNSINDDNLKIAFYTDNMLIPHFFSILKNLPADKVDIVLHRKEDSIPELPGYNILTMDRLKDYDIIITDHTREIRNNDQLKVKKLIALAHGMDAPIANIVFSTAACVIASSLNQINTNLLYFDDDVKPSQFIDTIDTNSKCEFAYTGPYQMDDWINITDEQYIANRSKIENSLETRLPNDRPLVCIIEDAFTDNEQLVEAMNQIAQFATIILKPLTLLGYPQLMDKLDRNIIVLKDKRVSLNLARFTADFVFVGTLTSSFISALSVGLCVIPYYSKILNPKWFKGAFPISWDRDIPKYINPIRECSYKVALYKFNEANKLFDITDIDKIRSAILGIEYRKWYKQNIKKFQREIFGDYTLEDPGKKTADYIMRFINEGTLGDDCKGVYLKNMEG